MNKYIIMSAVVSVSVLVGCYVPSLHPLYTKQDLLFNPELLGQWCEVKDGNSQWVFEKESEKSYTVRVTQEEKKTFVFRGHLLKVGAYHYLDLFPDTDDPSNENFLLRNMLPIHTFVRIRQLSPTLDMDVPSFEWLTKLVKEQPGVIQHETMLFGEKEDPLVVLTAKPKEMQTFFEKHEKTEKAWNKLEPLKKQVKQEEKKP